MNLTRREFFAAPLAAAATRSELRLAICNETFQNARFADGCRMARRAGFTGLEIAPFTLAEDPSALTPQQRRDLRAAMRAEGVKYAGLHAILSAPKGLHLTAPDAATRRRSWEFFRKMIDLCADLAGDRAEQPVLVLGSGRQRAAVDGASVGEAVARLEHGLAEMAAHAQSRRALILLEPLARHLCNVVTSMEEAAAIVRKVDSPALATMFDTHNAVDEPLPHDELIRKYYSYIHHVHLNEMDGRHPGTGDYDFAPVLRALKDLGYRRWASVEVFDFTPGGEQIAQSSFRFLRQAERRAPAPSAVTFRREDGKIHVLVEGRPFTTFHFGGKWDKPFLHPLRTAAGLVLTRGFPVEPAPGETNDHGWHRGLWYAHGDVNGADFWRERAGTGRLAPRGAPRTEGSTLSVELDLAAADGKVLGGQSLAFTFSTRGELRLIDVRAAFLADRGVALKLGDTEEGSLGVRLADAFREDRGAMLLNSDGLMGTKNIWGKRARWVDYSTTIGDQKAGVAIFDHPSNPKHPTWWHARGYALNAANPFGERDFTGDKTRDGGLTVPAGGRLEFRYRVVIHSGDAKSAGIEELYKAWK